MHIDMKGYKVVYGSSAYKCLAVETIFGPNNPGEGVIDRPERLCVYFIDHDGYVACVENYANQFVFVKDMDGK